MKLIIFLLLLSSCTSRIVVAKAKLSITNGRVHIQPMEKYRVIGDTVMEVMMIRRIK
jgi:hypothetical protein